MRFLPRCVQPRMLSPLAFASALVLLVPSQAFAHSGHAGGHGFAAGLLHPVTGLDHLLAMTAFGVLAAHLSIRARILAPLSFLLMMCAGAWAGAQQLGIDLAEAGIAVSLVTLGVMFVARARPSLNVALTAASAFAAVHGLAHGSEMPAGTSGLAYGAGFLAMTAVLLAAGFALGERLSKLDGATARTLERACGSALAAFGLALLAGAL